MGIGSTKSLVEGIYAKEALNNDRQYQKQMILVFKRYCIDLLLLCWCCLITDNDDEESILQG